MPALKNWGTFSIILAGWSSAEQGPVAYHLRGSKTDGRPAFHFEEVTRFRSPDCADVEFDVTNPAHSGLALMRRQRDLKHLIADGGPKPPVEDRMRNMMARPADRTDTFHIVSGFCQHTKIDRDGIHTKVLERWPDKIA